MLALLSDENAQGMTVLCGAIFPVESILQTKQEHAAHLKVLFFQVVQPYKEHLAADGGLEVFALQQIVAPALRKGLCRTQNGFIEPSLVAY